MNRPNGTNPAARGVGLLFALGALTLAIGCGSAGRPPTSNGGDGGNAGEGGGGSGGSGGAVPTNLGGSGGDTGGSSGASGAGGGSSGSGGAAGEGGMSGMSGEGGSDSPDAAMMSMDAATTSPGDGGGGKNTCPAKVTNYRLTGFSVSDFCDAYEKFCMYTPDGSLKSKCGPGQKIGPLFKDRADCEMQYMMASDAGKACRAGQLCQNAPRGLIVNACSHATGYCDPTCGK